MKQLLLVTIFLVISKFSTADNGFLQSLQYRSINNHKTLIVFYKSDCPYCANMDKVISADAAFQKQLTSIFNVQVFDITSAEGRLVADKFNVHAVPTIVQYNNISGESIITKGFSDIEKLSIQLGIKISTSTTKTVIQNTFNVCGDGIVGGGEQCDDGNISNGDGCNASCNVEAGYTCTGSPSICSSVCGDGIVGAGEQCDDGNLINGDGCNSFCQFEIPPNNECAGAYVIGGTSGTLNGYNNLATNSGVASSTCGAPNKDVWYSFTIVGTKNYRININGPNIADPIVVLYSGICGALVQVACNDDAAPGNVFSQIQGTLTAGTYYVRVGSFNTTNPGIFSLVYNFNLSNICGNNIIESTEECDDGNTTNGDGCSSTCKIENASSITGVSINNDSTRANPSAMLEVKSYDKGILVPRMNSSQRTSIASPAKGLLVFDITTNTFWYYSGSIWSEFGGTAGNTGAGLPSGATSQTLRNNGTNWVANSVLQNDGTNVTVTGQLKINGGTPGLNKVLTSDATGLGTWKDAAGAVAFSLGADSSRTLIGGTGNLRVHFGPSGFNVLNKGNAFNTATDEFVAPTDGLYYFVTDLYVNSIATTFSLNTKLQVDNSSNVAVSTQNFRDNIEASGSVQNFSHSAIFNLNAGDKVYVVISKNPSGGTANVVIQATNGTPTSTFSGYKIN